MRGKSALAGQGGADGPGFVSFSTSGQSRSDRFDFWRALYPSVTLDPASRQPYQGQLHRFTASNRCTFAVSGYDDTHARFDKSNSRYLLFTACIGGDALVEDDRGNAVVSAPDTGLVVIDATHSVQTRTRSVGQISLIVPRDRFTDHARAVLEGNDNGVFVLPDHGVTKFLLAQMHMLARQAGTIDSDSADVVVHTMADQAVAALAQFGAGEGALIEGRHERALVAAACRFIALHLGDHDLTTARISQAIGCSRAQLFRVFEREGQSIGDVIRQSRLTHARELLRANPSLSIEQIAYRSGYRSAAAFARAFREALGVSPREFRSDSVLF